MIRKYYDMELDGSGDIYGTQPLSPGLLLEENVRLQSQLAALQEEIKELKEEIGDLLLFTDEENNVINGFRTQDAIAELKQLLSNNKNEKG